MKLFFFQIPYTLSSNLNVFDRLTIAKVIYSNKKTDYRNIKLNVNILCLLTNLGHDLDRAGQLHQVHAQGERLQLRGHCKVVLRCFFR